MDITSYVYPHIFKAFTDCVFWLHKFHTAIILIYSPTFSLILEVKTPFKHLLYNLYNFKLIWIVYFTISRNPIDIHILKQKGILDSVPHLYTHGIKCRIRLSVPTEQGALQLWWLGSWRWFWILCAFSSGSWPICAPWEQLKYTLVCHVFKETWSRHAFLLPQYPSDTGGLQDEEAWKHPSNFLSHYTNVLFPRDHLCWVRES